MCVCVQFIDSFYLHAFPKLSNANNSIGLHIYIYINTYMAHTHRHACLHAHTHTYIHTYIYIYIHTHIIHTVYTHGMFMCHAWNVIMACAHGMVRCGRFACLPNLKTMWQPKLVVRHDRQAMHRMDAFQTCISSKYSQYVQHMRHILMRIPRYKWAVHGGFHPAFHSKIYDAAC